MSFRRFTYLALLTVLAAPAFAQTYIWTGEMPTGWQGQVTPPNDGTADLFFGDSLYPQITLSTSLDNINAIGLFNGNDITILSSSAITLNLATGIAFADEVPGSLDFASTINLGITGSMAMDAGESRITIRGQVTGTGDLTLFGGPAGNGTFVFSNTGAGNTYVGNTLVGTGSDFVSVAFWNSSPFGTGTVTFSNGGFLIAHGNDTITNPLVINLVGSSNELGLKSWNGPLTLSGPVTLDNNVVLSPKSAQTFLPAPTGDGSIVLPGPTTANPIVFSGNISESGGSRSVLVQGPGSVFFTGTSNTYSGGTTVGGTSTLGSLVFGANSIPASGAILSIKGSYVGTADPSGTSFATLVSHSNLGASTGSFGVDTLPGNSTVPYSGTIDLSSFTNSSNPVEIGTATSAILTGTIIPQSSTNFKFGGGGGTLYVDTPLANGVATNVLLANYGISQPLTVYLQAVNTYIGTTTAADGFLIFDAVGSMPGSTTLKAAGSPTSVGGSYIGYTDNVVGMTPTTFLTAFDKTNTWGIVGFDSSNPMSPVTINGVDLSLFNNGTYIGTSTAAVLTGTLTPSAVTNGSNAANTLRLTAVKSGVLTVNSTISDNGSPVSVLLGSPSFWGIYSSGTVNLNGTNSYTGGTGIEATNSDGLTVGVGSNSALGSGPVTLINSPGDLGLAGIQATTGGINLPNPIVFQDNGGTGAPALYLSGTNNFTLSGGISGDSTSEIILFNPTPITATISGNNAAYSGKFTVYNGTLKLTTSISVGSGLAELNLQGSSATIDLTGATTPVIESLHGAIGNLVLGPTTTLTVDQTPVTSDGGNGFGGIISGSGSLVVTNNSTSNSPAVLLYGNNTYNGGTTVTQNGLLVLASNQGAGTGPVTVATTSQGALALDTGVTFTNPIVFTSGNLAGYGTFDPSGLGLAGTVTIGTNQGVAPGFPASNNKIVTGKLSFAGNMAFNNGGSFYWTLQDNSRVDGVSQLNIAGNLTINATAGGFGINLLTYDSTGTQNSAANFNVNAPYSWVIATTGGTIQNFNAADFTLGVAGFENGIIPVNHLSLTVNGADNQLILNFTPVPEPSTYALVAIGLGLVAAAGLRRRRA